MPAIMANIRRGKTVTLGPDLRMGLDGIVRQKTNQGPISDHGALSGLADDDHPQYLTQTEADALYAPIAGTGAPTDAEYIVGALHASLSAERLVTNTATVTWDLATAGQAKANAVIPSFGSPTASVDIGDAQADGAATTVPRSDHQHAFPAPSAGYPQDIAGTEADGSATTPARSDHVHKGVTSVNGRSGAVTIGSGGSGGSIGRANDPRLPRLIMRNFIGNTGTSGQIGKLGWAFVNSTVAFLASEANHPGIIQKLQNNNTGSLNLGTSGGKFMLLPSATFDNYFIVRPQSQDGNCSLWIGYQDTPSGTGNANNVIYFRVALSTDTNWFAVTNNAATPTTAMT